MKIPVDTEMDEWYYVLVQNNGHAKSNEAPVKDSRCSFFVCCSDPGNLYEKPFT